MSQYIPFLDDPIPGRQPGGLDKTEKWWIERQEALEQAGYMLRPRYRLGWQPSWTGTNKLHLNFEDGNGLKFRLGMDATRISDGKQVMLKMLPTEEGPTNLKNHCVHLLDVIELPNDPPMIVYPLLRPFSDPPLQTYGEFVTFFSHISEGVQFMHENHVAHRDCTYGNLMLDPSNMFPESFHPSVIDRSKDFRRKAKWYSRTRRPTRYLLIDFGLSRRYDPANGPPLDLPIRGGFEFMEPLVTDMVQNDPTNRPTMDEVVTRFSEIKGKLSTWKLRSRIARKNELWPVTAWKSVGHWYRTVGYILGRKAAIPEPK
ncbi:hypothetical protein BJV77DRAFT_1152165 [Russula vinacea]|nr:hypothetical protein BJV77DRAFT_1152165 [Russula vinacea]